jgi:hypothetical protein
MEDDLSSSPLERVTFEAGSTLCTISDFAFGRCDSLASISIPASVAILDGASLARCGLREVTIDPENPHFRTSGSFIVRATEPRLVGYFGSESELIIPSEIETIGPSCFISCCSLEAVDFAPGSRLSLIEESAFERCICLRSICIPATVRASPDT